MARRQFPPDAVLPLIGTIAGCVLGVMLFGAETQWPIWVSTIVGAIAGIVVNALTRRA
jgi:hypothetical protein